MRPSSCVLGVETTSLRRHAIPTNPAQDETDGCEEIDFSDVRMDEASEEAARAAKRARRESGADGPPVLRPASAAVGKPERRETLVVNDDAPTVEELLEEVRLLAPLAHCVWGLWAVCSLPVEEERPFSHIEYAERRLAAFESLMVDL